MGEVAIDVRHFSFRYPDGDRWILDDLTLTAHRGETILLLGPSGCGKSTFALCLKGLIPHMIEGETRGTITIEGTDAGQEASLQQVGIVFQDPDTQLVMPRVNEEIAFGLENLAIPVEKLEARIDRALSQIGLSTMKRQWVEALSVGQKQRLALASVIAMEPSLLILDEPTANLDPYGTVSFFENLTVLKKTLSMTIFLIEHRIDMALPLVDRVIIMNRKGRIISSGDPGRIFGNDTGSLEAEGIWLPTPCRLAGELKRRGFPVSRNPLSLDDTEELFRSIFSLPKAGKSGSQDISPSTTLKESDLAVSIEGLSFAYAGGPKVLDGVCLQVERGAFLALVGENGAGKSTLAKSLSGLIRPKSGDIFIMGYPAKAIKSSCFVRYVGYVFQNPEHQFVTERVSDELSYSLRRHYAEEEVERRLEELLHNFDLKGYEDANPFSLSQGQKRRLSVATMIALDQPILILDEPTFGQDRGSTLSLMELVQSLHKRGKTIILITHDMQLVLEYAWSAAVMHQGKILFKGSPHSLFQSEDILSTASLTLPFEAQLGNRLGDPELFTQRDWFDRL